MILYASFHGMPGMCNNYDLKGLGYNRQQEALAEGKGVHCEVESEGSRMSRKKTWRAKFRTDEQKPHIRPNRGGRVCVTKRSPMLPEPHTVNEAVTRNEGYRSYPGRSCRREVGKNPNAAVTTNCKKSAEAIVPEFFRGEGPNNRKSSVKTGRRSA